MVCADVIGLGDKPDKVFDNVTKTKPDAGLDKLSVVTFVITVPVGIPVPDTPSPAAKLTFPAAAAKVMVLPPLTIDENCNVAPEESAAVVPADKVRLIAPEI